MSEFAYPPSEINDLEDAPEDEPQLRLGAAGDVWRVGWAPDPWAWAPWEYANEPGGLFPGRWDDAAGQFRTIYAADALLGCFLELLAKFRPSAQVIAELDEIADDDGSVALYNEAPPGAVGYRWLEDRVYGAARLAGAYCAVTHSRSVAAIARRFPLEEYGYTARDFDVSVLKQASDRKVTRGIARWLYDMYAGEQPFADGVRFTSRLGDELGMWAVFERPDDGTRSPRLQHVEQTHQVAPDTPELLEAFNWFGLHWHNL